MASSKTAISKHISVPRDLAAAIDKKLAVGGFGTVPRNAYTTLVVGLLQAWLDGRILPIADEEIEKL